MSPKPATATAPEGAQYDLTAGAQCRECAREGFTCCQPAYGVTLSFHDARRLMEASGKPLAEICKLRRIKDPELLEGLRIDPWFRRLFIGKDRLLQTRQGVRKKGTEFDCYFLGKEGCRVFADRPRLCHLHPFWFDRHEDEEGGRVRWSFYFDAIDDELEAAEADCLIVNRLWPDLARGMASIGEGEATFVHHAEQMVAEILWQSERLRELKERTGKKLSKLKLADIEDLVASAPLERLTV